MEHNKSYQLCLYIHSTLIYSQQVTSIKWKASLYLNGFLLLSEHSAVMVPCTAVQMEDSVTLATQVAATFLTQDHGWSLPIIMVLTCWLCMIYIQ